MRRSVALALAILATASSIPAIADAQATGVVWWGPTAPDQGYHLRIPVIVRNPYPFPVVDTPAFAEIDVAPKLFEAGWIKQPQGDRDVLKSFSLDLDSFRVVEVTDLQPSSSGPSHGRLMTYDPTLPLENDKRYEVPSVVYAGALAAPAGKTFDPDTNPTVTLLWRVEGELQPHAAGGQERTFVIYFDSTRNGDKLPTSYTTSVGGGALASTFWAGSGLTLYGNVAPGPTQVGTVHVIPLHDGTQVTVATRNEAGTFRPVTAPSGFPANPVTLGKHEARELFVSSGRQAVFRVESSKPAIAFVEGAGFVPSLSGSMVGSEFIFPLNHEQIWEQDSIYFSSTNPETTTVEVRRIGEPTAVNFEVNSPSNDRPYTVGARSGTIRPPGGAGACTLVDPTRPSPLLTTPGYYHAKVVRGGPVLLQIAPSRGVVQIPTIQGAPTGTQFMGAAGWTDLQSNHNGASPSCNDTSRSGSFIAAAVSEASALRVTSADFVGQVYPTGRDPTRLPPAAPVGLAPSDQDGPTLSPLLDRPLSFEATQPITLIAGIMPPIGRVDRFLGLFGFPDGAPVRTPSGIPFIHGPVGGADVGRVFSSYGPSTVLALYNDTVVQTDLSYTGGARVEGNAELAAQGAIELDDLDDLDRLSGVRVVANRPVILIPKLDHSAALAAVPAFLPATLQLAEFRGYMVQVSSPTGLNPVTDSTLPGTPITYKAKVKNLGRGIGGSNLADTVQLTATAPAGWTVRLDRQSLFLQSNQVEEVHVTVTPPATLPSGSIGQVSLRATSSGNPNMDDSLQLVTLIKRSFGVGIWFDQIGNPQRTQTLIVSRGGQATYNVTVKNTGAVADVIAVTATEPGEPDWEVRLRTLGGQTVEALSLAAGATAKLQLVAVPGPTAKDATIVTVLTAASTSEPAAQDQLVAITKMRSPSNVKLTTPTPIGYVEPGETLFFPLEFKNSGAGSAELSFGVEIAADPVWNITGVVARDAFGAPSENLTELTLSPGQSVELWVAAAANASSPAWAFSQMQVTARVAGTSQALEAVLQGSVLPVHRLDQVLPPLPLLAQKDVTNVSAKVRLTNAGNLNETFTVRAEDLPSGWSLVAPAKITINKTATQELSVTIRIPTTAEAGAYNVTIALESEDGNLTFVKLPTLVGSLALGYADGAKEILARPGAWVTSTFAVRNDGNVPVKLRLSAPGTETWTWTSPQADLEIPAGAQVALTVSYLVPLDAPDGVSVHTLRLEMKPTDPNAVTVVQTLTTRASVGRPDLTVENATAFQGPAGTLVRGQVRNLGPRAAENVTVELRSGGRLLNVLLVREVAPASRSNVTLVAGSGEGGTLSFIVDATDTNKESDENNNAVEVDAALRSGKGTPGSGSLAVLVVLLVGAMARTRRRPADR